MHILQGGEQLFHKNLLKKKYSQIIKMDKFTWTCSSRVIGRGLSALAHPVATTAEGDRERERRADGGGKRESRKERSALKMKEFGQNSAEFKTNIRIGLNERKIGCSDDFTVLKSKIDCSGPIQIYFRTIRFVFSMLRKVNILNIALWVDL
jgi:hypothetical protein